MKENMESIVLDAIFRYQGRNARFLTMHFFAIQDAKPDMDAFEKINAALDAVDEELDNQIDGVMESFERFCASVLEVNPGDTEVLHLLQLVKKYRENHKVGRTA